MGAFADLQRGSGCAAVLGSPPVIVAAGESRLPVESGASPRLTGETPVAPSYLAVDALLAGG
jgi:hypothetical protein